MSPLFITLFLFLSLLAAIFLGIPIIFCLGGVAVIFGLWLWGPNSLYLVASGAWDQMSSFILVAVPLFVFMAIMLERSGIAEDLYEVMFGWMGPLRGGLVIGTIVICTLLGAMTGISTTGAVAMGITALPAMLKRHHDFGLVIGAIASGAGLGVIIPPSVLMIVYGLVASESIGKLFAGGIFTGLLLSFVYIAYIAIRAWRNPVVAPSLAPEDRYTWGRKLSSLRGVVLPVILIIVVLGAIFTGATTPTEAAAIGALGATICAVVHRRLNRDTVKQTCIRTLLITAMVMWILMAGKLFSSVYIGLGAPKLIVELLGGMNMSPWIALMIMELILFLLGMVIDPAAIVMITIPMFTVIGRQLGFDMLWFALVNILMIQLGYITPPFGLVLFYLRGIVPQGYDMAAIYRGVIPFVLLQLIAIGIVIAFPPIAVWLPNTLFPG